MINDDDTEVATHLVYKIQCFVREPPWVNHLIIANAVKQLLLIITKEG